MDDVRIKLDKIDQKIIRMLARDSRMPLSAMARAAHVSVDTAKNRLHALKTVGVVSALFAEPDLAALGLRTFRLYVDVAAMPVETRRRLMQAYRTHGSTQWVAWGEGAWDFILRFSLPDESAFKAEVESFMNRFGAFVQRKSITLGMYQSYFPPTYLAGGERRARIRFDSARLPAKLSAADYRILSALYDDARIPTTHLAQALRLTPEAVQYRLKRLLEKGVIQGYSAWFDSQPAGFEFHKVFFWLQNLTPQQEKNFVRYLESDPHVAYLVRVLGDWDLEVDVHVQSPRQLHDFISSVEKRFPGLVRDHASLVILENAISNPLGQFLETPLSRRSS